SGSLSFSGDTGDYISGGQSYAYSTPTDTLNVYGSVNDNNVEVSVAGADGAWWYLDLAAPSGQILAPGTYDNAARDPFQGPTQPGLSFYGDGRGCNTVTGSFTVQQAVFGPQGYVQELDATFTQHCEGLTPALYGEVHITNPPPPAQLSLGLNVATTGEASSLDGNATISGTVSCNASVSVPVSGSVTEVVNKEIVRGNYSTSVACTPDAPAPWSATSVPTGSVPFRQGEVEVQTHAQAVDPVYGNTVSADQTTAVQLKHS
ncbi:MAG TPA: hypothetical protein VFG87_26190, partial [Amycolatopsis sp.]|nr:hypothetical protein [Amycolatopsis sp.]